MAQELMPALPIPRGQANPAFLAHVLIAKFCDHDPRGRYHPCQCSRPANRKTKTGRFWVYLRDEVPHAGAALPAELYHYTPDRKASIAAPILPPSPVICMPMGELEPAQHFR